MRTRSLIALGLVFVGCVDEVVVGVVRTQVIRHANPPRITPAVPPVLATLPGPFSRPDIAWPWLPPEETPPPPGRCEAVAYPDLSDVFGTGQALGPGESRSVPMYVVATGTGPCLLLGRSIRDRIDFSHCSVLEPQGFSCDPLAASPWFTIESAPADGTVLAPNELLQIMARVTAPDVIEGATVMAARLRLTLVDPNAEPDARFVRPGLLGTVGDGPNVYAVAAAPDIGVSHAPLDLGRIASGDLGVLANVSLYSDPRLPEAFVQSSLSPACGSAVRFPGVIPADTVGPEGLRFGLIVGPDAVPDGCTLDLAVVGGPVRRLPIRATPGSGTERVEALTAEAIRRDVILVVDDSLSMKGLESQVTATATWLSAGLTGNGDRLAIGSAEAFASGVVPVFNETLIAPDMIPTARASARRLEPTGLGLARAAESAAEAGLLVPTGDLDVIVVTNEDDTSPSDARFYAARVRGAHPSARVHVVVAMSNFEACGLGSAPATRLRALALVTGGTASDLCGETAETIATRLADTGSEGVRVHLAARPASGTAVKVRTPSCEFYVPSLNARRLVIPSACAVEGDLIVVEYRVPPG